MWQTTRPSRKAQGVATRVCAATGTCSGHKKDLRSELLAAEKQADSWQADVHLQRAGHRQATATASASCARARWCDSSLTGDTLPACRRRYSLLYSCALPTAFSSVILHCFASAVMASMPASGELRDYFDGLASMLLDKITAFPTDIEGLQKRGVDEFVIRGHAGPCSACARKKFNSNLQLHALASSD